MIFSDHGHLYLPKLCFFAVNIYISSSLNYPRHSALQEDTGFSIVTQETDDIFKIFKQIHDWKS